MLPKSYAESRIINGAKKRPAGGPFSSQTKVLKNNARSTANLTQKVGRQFDYLLLVVSFDAVIGDFQNLLHWVPRVGLTRKYNFTA